jgi:hypothetical protein
VANGLNMIGSPAVVISDLESIIIAHLDVRDPAVAGSGEFTAVMTGNGGSTGVGLVEVYDLDDQGTPTELANISTRGVVGTADDVLIGGVIIGPSDGSLTNTSVVVRALGPSLANFGVTDALADPMVDLLNADGDPIAMNDNWETDPTPDNYSAEVMAAGLAPTDPAEAAVFANLVPGQYTAIVMGVNGGVGVALVEIYHVAASAAAK